MLLACFGMQARPPATWWGILGDTWTEGAGVAYVSGWYWHAPSSYSPERRRELNTAALGLGWGRSMADAEGREHALLFMASRSSHHKPQYLAAYLRTSHRSAPFGLRAGLGYTVFVFARSDIYRYLPLPGILPIASLGGDRWTLYLSYLPGIGNGITGTGNVAYVFARIRL